MLSRTFLFEQQNRVTSEQEKVEVVKKRDVEGMGIPEIKYGESMCFVQHVSTGLWLTYAALDAKAARLGTMKRKVLSRLHTLHVTTRHFLYLTC